MFLLYGTYVKEINKYILSYYTELFIYYLYGHYTCMYEYISNGLFYDGVCSWIIDNWGIGKDLEWSGMTLINPGPFDWLGLFKWSGTLFIFVYRYFKFKILYFDINSALL
jgi:hypothetical protein